MRGLRMIAHLDCLQGVVDPLTDKQLKDTLELLFGPVDLDIVRGKACAFGEFATLEAAKRAIVHSLHPAQGGEGGIKIDTGSDSAPVRINVETKKERGERPPPRGGFRGGRGGGGNMRGGRGGGGPPGK